MSISKQVNSQIEILRSLSFECHCQWKEELEFVLSDAANTIESLSTKLEDMERSAEDCGGGWKPISEYSRDKHDWVLIKYFDGEEECVPQVAELRSDGKWHVSTDFDGDFVIPSWLDVRYFFDMQTI